MTAKVVAVYGMADEAICQAFPRNKLGTTGGVRNRE